MLKNRIIPCLDVKDGTKSGYDVDLLKTITNNINIPVIASGGVGTLDHLYDGMLKVVQVQS